MVDVKLDVVLGMPFLTINNANIDFQAQYLEHKTVLVYVTALTVDSGDEIHPLKRAQITYLKADKAPAKAPCKYADFADVFSPNLAAELPKHTEINNHTIKLVND